MKKKPVKKAAKKTVPKVKLIEGKYSHKFLTRLEPRVGEKFEELKKRFNQKTFSGTIVLLIEKHLPLLNEVEVLQTENHAAKSKYINLNDKVDRFRYSFSQLIKEPDTNDIKLSLDNECPTCGETLYKNGDCPDGCDND